MCGVRVRVLVSAAALRELMRTLISSICFHVLKVPGKCV